jgi:hypothetical protein
MNFMLLLDLEQKDGDAVGRISALVRNIAQAAMHPRARPPWTVSSMRRT